jgi:predicted transport protein
LPKIQLNDINDYKKLAHNVPEERWWWKIVEFNIESKEDIIYAMDLIQQAYKKYY